MKRLLFIFIIVVSGTAFAQESKLRKSEDLFNRLAYAEAAEIYQGLLDSKVDSPELRAKLATCYTRMGDVENAVFYFSSIVDKESLDVENVYDYAQVLKQNEQYVESDLWMQKYYALQVADSRAKDFEANKDYLSKILAQEPLFVVDTLKINSINSDFGGYVKNDEFYFVSNRLRRSPLNLTHTWNNQRFLDLYKIHIDTNSNFDNVEYLKSGENKRFHEGPLCFSPDGTKVYFTRNNMSAGEMRRSGEGIQNLKIYIADIDNNGQWNNEREFPLNSKEYSIGHPSISSDGKLLYFVSDMPGGFGGADIYSVEIKSDGSFGSFDNLGSNVNSEGHEMFPWIDGEGRLFFASNGWVGLGGLDIYVVFNKDAGHWDGRKNLGQPINSSKDDFSLVMLKDNKTGYFSSNRDGGKGDDDIYSFILTGKLNGFISIKGVIADNNSKEILSNALVELFDESGTLIASSISDEQGKYSFDLEPEQKYQVRVSKDNYFSNKVDLITDKSDDNVELNQDVFLDKDPGLSLYALITDAQTKEPLNGVNLVIKDKITGEIVDGNTSASGEYFHPLADKKLDDMGSYTIILKRDGYFPKTVDYQVNFTREGAYNLHESLDITMDKEVKDVREMVEINPINFDLGKWNIRPDAAEELDKIIDVMNKYPEMVVELGSHTDCRASKSFNMKLSDKRAKSSAEYIQKKISNPSRIYGKGYGESQLLNDCGCEGNVKSDCSEEEHEKNRRTEFKIISMGE